MPLGDAWDGVCNAVPGEEFRPAREVLKRLCNFGYACQSCRRLPAHEPDAVRFSIAGDIDGVIRILWVVEKGHLPVAHGALEYARSSGEFRGGRLDDRLTKQARAYATSYLLRREATSK